MTTNPQRFRHRTAEIEAVQWTGSNTDELRAFAGSDFDTIDPEDRIEDPDQTAAVRTHPHGGWLGLKPGDWVLKREGHFMAVSDEAFRAEWEAAVSPPPATDRAALRDRIAQALHDQMPGCAHDEHGNDCAVLADAVLAVLPPPADRAAVLREAAQRLYTALFPAVYDDMGQKAAEGVNRAVSELRRMAGEEQPGTEARDDQGGALIEDYLRFLRGQGPEPDLSELSPQERQAIAGQFEIVKALADRDPELPPLDRDSVALRLGLAVKAQQQPESCGQTRSVDGTEYPPCARSAGHEEAYCRSSDGKAYFLASDGPGRVADEEPATEAQLPFIYVDDDGDQLDIGVVMASTYDGEAPVVYVAADQHQGDQMATVYVRPERVVEVIAALRAARQATEALPAEAPR